MRPTTRKNSPLLVIAPGVASAHHLEACDLCGCDESICMTLDEAVASLSLDFLAWRRGKKMRKWRKEREMR